MEIRYIVDLVKCDDAKVLFNIVIHDLISHFTMFEKWGEWAFAVRAHGYGALALYGC